MILLIDNYDSFVFNLARYIEELGHKVEVHRNDRITIEEIKEKSPYGIIISPGPCTPAEAGISKQVIQTFHQTIPILGVCLGHQAIGEVFGHKTIRAIRPMHGKTSQIEHQQLGIMEQLPSPLTVTRYHSLVVDPTYIHHKDSVLQIESVTEDGDIMAFSHKTYPVYGVQFHPEAVLTQGGHKLLENFLVVAINFQKRLRSSYDILD